MVIRTMVDVAIVQVINNVKEVLKLVKEDMIWATIGEKYLGNYSCEG